MKYNKEPTETSTSKLNSGMLINFRLNDLWKDAHRHSRAGFYTKWNDDLDRIWCELAGDVKPTSSKDDEDGDEEKYEMLTMEYAKSTEGSTTTLTGFATSNKNHKVSMVKQKQALIKKEIFLRRLQNKQGKGTAYYDEDEDDFD